MGANTGISWTDATWNCIRGCSRVSDGCRNCYAESIAHRFSGPGLAYEGLVQLDADGKSTGKWNGRIEFVEKHLLDPLKWKEPRRIFVNSMSDLFHENVTDEMRDRIFAVMALCPQHTFQVLTKRPERMLEYLSASDATKRIHRQAFEVAAYKAPGSGKTWNDPTLTWPLKNVHLGVSVEDQKTADERIPLLLQTPAAVRFISAEPLLGSLNIRPYLGIECAHEDSYSEDDTNATICRKCEDTPILDWVIVGGESGHGARPMHPDWARRLRDQCKAAGVPYFFKQWGEYGAGSVHMTSGERVFRQFENFHNWVNKASTWVSGGICLDADGVLLETGGGFKVARYPVTIMHRIGTKAAGHLLDGVEHHEFPEVR